MAATARGERLMAATTTQVRERMGEGCVEGLRDDPNNIVY
jgi:hypothetical protein